MIVMGRISAPFGLNGWVKVQPFTEQTDGLIQYPEWWLSCADGWDGLKIEETAIHGDVLLVKFAGVQDRDRAATFKGREVAIPREQMPAAQEGEYYWSDLVGLDVENTQGRLLGRVERLFESGASPVLVVVGERERLLPYVENVVKGVDLDAKKLLVDWELDY
jgi:16S rRNA processing protein RimM